MKSTVIVLNWNNAPDTLECLASLDATGAEVLVVDNGSTDGSAELIQKAYPHIPLLKNESNLGFAAGNNRGIEWALERGTELVILLNNDTVVARDFVEELVAAAKLHPEAGAFGAKIYYYDDPATIWYAGGDVEEKSMRCYHIGCGDPDYEKKHHDIRETGYACGCAIAVRAEVIREVGTMGPDFFLLWEEIDWCWRMRKSGWKCLFVPKARVWHKISASFPEGNRGSFWRYHYARSRFLFLKRNYTKKQRLKFYLIRSKKELVNLFFVKFLKKSILVH